MSNVTSVLEQSKALSEQEQQELLIQLDKIIQSYIITLIITSKKYWSQAKKENNSKIDYKQNKINI